jgi:signal transduction histidine kinase
MPLLVGLLVVTFAIAADLAHEAWSTALAQQRTATRAGEDFVRYTATGAAYETQASIALALRALFAPVATSHAAPPSAAIMTRGVQHVRDCHCAPLVIPRTFFRLHLPDGELQLAGDSVSAAERAWLRDTITAHVKLVRQPDWDDALLYGVVGGRPRVTGYTTRPSGDAAPEYVYGIVSDATAFGEAVVRPRPSTRAPRAGAMAPAASYDSLLRTLIIAPDGDVLYGGNARRQDPRVTMLPRVGHESYLPGAAPVPAVTVFADTVPLGPRYASLRLGVALVTDDPGALVAGGLSRSRLFALFGLLVLMAGLVVAAMLQLRREHELAHLRADLTAGVSHELRTPLAQILLFGETLMLERTRSDRERRAAAEVVVREARRLMHLVENALHFTRADRDLLEPSSEVIDLAAETREILVAFAPLAWTAKVSLREEIDAAAPALVDGAAYRQIVLNLLENAVRYGPTGQTVTVRVERLDRSARVAVEDEGAGVPIADRERIWAPFVRLTNGRRGTNGTGIGLAVVRDLTARHGGRAWVERAERGGARFVVELPSSSATLRKDSGHGAAAPPARAAL